MARTTQHSKQECSHQISICWQPKFHSNLTSMHPWTQINYALREWENLIYQLPFCVSIFLITHFSKSEHVNLICTGNNDLWIECFEKIVCDRVDQFKGAFIRIKPYMLVNFPCTTCHIPHVFHIVE